MKSEEIKRENDNLFEYYRETRSLEIRNQLVLLNLDLVGYCLKNFNYNIKDEEDLKQCGIEGLIKAIEGYDSKKGISFSTYAFKVINSHIIKGLNIDRKYESRRFYSIEDEEDDDEFEFVDEKTNVEKDVILKNIVGDALNNSGLSDKAKEILFKRYYSQYTQVELSRLQNVSRQRINEIERTSLRKIKKYLNKNYENK